MSHRLLAVLGSIAYGIRHFAGSLLSFIGLRELGTFAAPVLIAALATAAVISARDTAEILASRPEVQETTLADVASREDPAGSVWFEFDALIAESHLSTPADLGTFFYLARDPAEPAAALLVRSNLNDAFVRERVLSARIVEDEGVVAAALEELPPLPGGFTVEKARFLDEVRFGGEADDAFLPSQLAEEPGGSEVLVTGRVVTPISHAACANGDCEGADAAWYYYLADRQGGDAMILRSPHPPDAIPVRLQGLYLRDTFDLAPVLESEWFETLDADVPTDRTFAAGSRPPIMVQASWVPTTVFAALALLLLASQLIGYPVFGGRLHPQRRRSLAIGERIDVDITGRLARPTGPLALDGSPGAVERLSIADLALRMWRYGLLPRDLSRRAAEERFVAEAAGESDRLVVHERDQSALVTIGHSADAVEVEAGRLYRLAGSRPAVHVRQGTTNAYLTLHSTDDRDRVAAEIGAEARRDASAP